MILDHKKLQSISYLRTQRPSFNLLLVLSRVTSQEQDKLTLVVTSLEVLNSVFILTKENIKVSFHNLGLWKHPITTKISGDLIKLKSSELTVKEVRRRGMEVFIN